jgi:hypothetical protein
MSGMPSPVMAEVGTTLMNLRGSGLQGLTLVHFSAQRKRILWVRGCIQGLCRGGSGGGMAC